MTESQSPGFDLQERVEGDSVTLVLAGELDISATDGVQRAADRACVAEGSRALIIDLQRLTFIDSSGLAAMVHVSRLCERRGCRLSVIRGPQAVHEVFELTGLDRLLPFGAVDAGPVSD
jgi:anti-anti-sigma factor